MTSGTGTAAVLRDALKGAGAEIARADAAAAGGQLPMFEVPTRFHGPRGEAVRAAVERRSAPGRPAGSENLLTREMRAYLLARGLNPLIALMRYALMPPDLLAAELGCSKLEAFREWRALQEGLAPFLFGKAAPTDDQGKAVPFISLAIGGMLVAPKSDAEPPWIAALRQMQQNQGVIDLQPAVSHAGVSHGGEKPA